MAKKVRFIAAIFVAMAMFAWAPHKGALAFDGVDVSDNTCAVRSVAFSVSPNEMTEGLAGVRTGHAFRCYAIVINRVDGSYISGTITRGPTNDLIGWTRPFSATVTATATGRPEFRFALRVGGVDTTYRVEILPNGKLHVFFSSSIGKADYVTSNFTPYTKPAETVPN